MDLLLLAGSERMEEAVTSFNVLDGIVLKYCEVSQGPSTLKAFRHLGPKRFLETQLKCSPL